MKQVWLWILALLVILVWAETFVSSKVLLDYGLMPADIFFYRFILSYVCLIFLSHKRVLCMSWADELLCVLLGITGGSLYFLCENMALKFSTASNVAILVGTTPLLTALLLAVFYHEERLSRRQVLGSFIAFVGLVLVVLNGQLVLHLNPVGDALAMGASVTWALYSLFIKRLSGRYDVMFVTRKVFAYGLITILPWFVWIEPLQLTPAILSQPVVWVNLLYLGLIAAMGCFLLWNWLLPRLGVVKATNLIYSQSAFTMFIAAIVLGERITLLAVAGVITLTLGMLLATRKSRLRLSSHRRH